MLGDKKVSYSAMQSTGTLTLGKKCRKNMNVFMQ